MKSSSYTRHRSFCCCCNVIHPGGWVATTNFVSAYCSNIETCLVWRYRRHTIGRSPDSRRLPLHPCCRSVVRSRRSPSICLAIVAKLSRAAIPPARVCVNGPLGYASPLSCCFDAGAEGWMAARIDNVIRAGDCWSFLIELYIITRTYDALEALLQNHWFFLRRKRKDNRDQSTRLVTFIKLSQWKSPAV